MNNHDHECYIGGCKHCKEKSRRAHKHPDPLDHEADDTVTFNAVSIAGHIHNVINAEMVILIDELQNIQESTQGLSTALRSGNDVAVRRMVSNLAVLCKRFHMHATKYETLRNVEEGGTRIEQREDV